MSTQKSEQPEDWHPADVIAALRKNNTSLRQIAIKNGYSHVQRVLTSPWWVIEQLVAKSLHTEAQLIWPSRYADGVSREHAKRLTRNRQAMRQARATAKGNTP